MYCQKVAAQKEQSLLAIQKQRAEFEVLLKDHASHELHDVIKKCFLIYYKQLHKEIIELSVLADKEIAEAVPGLDGIANEFKNETYRILSFQLNTRIRYLQHAASFFKAQLRLTPAMVEDGLLSDTFSSKKDAFEAFVKKFSGHELYPMVQKNYEASCQLVIAEQKQWSDQTNLLVCLFKNTMSFLRDQISRQECLY